MKLKLAHIVNPYTPRTGTEHFVSQPIVLQSIIAAGKNKDPEIELELYAAVLKGDEYLVPEGFKIVFLERTLKDIVTFKNARPLPLIADIIKLLDTNSNADHFIYTNMDIGLQTSFYNSVAEYLQKGNDTLVINRRGISDRFNSVEQLPEIYNEKGNSHPGYDCFVFRKELCDKFIFKTICLGIPRFERVFVLNLINFSNTILFLDNVYLTFHIGEIVYKNWGDKNHYAHNEKEYKKIRRELLKTLNITKFPYWKENFIKRYWRWLWNPNFSLPDNLILEWRYRLGLS